jgi:hypothetical protein
MHAHPCGTGTVAATPRGKSYLVNHVFLRGLTGLHAITRADPKGSAFVQNQKGFV